MLICSSGSDPDVAESGGLTFGAAVVSSILAFVGWFLWGIYSGVIAVSAQASPSAPSYSYIGLGIGITFTAAAIVFWVMIMTSKSA